MSGAGDNRLVQRTTFSMFDANTSGGKVYHLTRTMFLALWRKLQFELGWGLLRTHAAPPVSRSNRLCSLKRFSTNASNVGIASNVTSLFGRASLNFRFFNSPPAFL